MSQLVPEVRVNKNGVAVTKHVRPDAGRPSDAVTRPVPAPSVAAPVAAAEAPESPDERFERIRKANSDFIYGRDPVTIDNDGHRAMADLLYALTETDEEGGQRIDLATYVVRSGDALGARSMMMHQTDPNRMQPPDAAIAPFTVFDVWDRGCDAGVLERNHLYTPGDPEASLYPFLIDFFIAHEWADNPVFPITEASEGDLRELAIIHECKPDTEPGPLAEFFGERGQIDATLYLNAVEGAPAVRDGVL